MEASHTPDFRRIGQLLLTLCVSLYVTSAATAGGAPAQAPSDSLGAVIDSLRVQARYGEAVGVAETLLARLKAGAGAKPYQVADAERLITTLRFAATLPESSRAELAEADRLTAVTESAQAGGRFEEWETAARRQLATRAKLLGENHQDVALSLNSVAGVRMERGDYAEADSLCREALAMQRELLGDEHPDLAFSLDQLGSVNVSLGYNKEGEGLFREALAMYRELSAEETLDEAAVEANLTWALLGRGDYAAAEASCRQALAIRRMLLGKEHPLIAASLRDLASVLKRRGEIVAAERPQLEALAMCQRLFGEEHLEVARSLNNAGNLYMFLGDCAVAEPYFRKAYTVMRGILGEEHPEVAVALNNLAFVHEYRGDYAAAEPLYREALALDRKLLREDHQDIADRLTNLGGCLRERGDYAAAEEIEREALSKYRKALGSEHPEVARAINNLALVLDTSGDHTGAEPLFREALAMRRRLLGNDHWETAVSLDNLASNLTSQGKYEEAEPLCREALAVFRKRLGERHPDVALTLNHLAAILAHRGDYAGAEKLHRDALEIQTASLGNVHPDVAITLTALGGVEHLRGNDATAEQVLEEATRTFEAARLRAGSGIVRAVFLKKPPYGLLAETRLAMGQNHEAWVATERGQGRALIDLLIAAESRRLSPEEARLDDSLATTLTALESQLKALRRAARADSSEEARRRVEETATRLLGAEARWGAFEQEMASKHPVTEGQVFDLARVQASLAGDEAILGWLDGEKTYGARPGPSWGYVIRSDGPVTWRRMPDRETGGPGTAASRSSTFRKQVSRRPTTSEPPMADAQAVWQERLAPLMEALNGVRHLIVIPSGGMLGLPVETLAMDGGEYIGDRFAVSYVPSATIHAWLSEKEAHRPAGLLATGSDRSGNGDAEPTPRCLALGDPPFRSDETASVAARPLEEPAPAGAPSQDETFLLTAAMRETFRGEEDLVVRSALAGNEDLLRDLRPLPATREEARVVASLHGQGSRLLLGPEASEQQLVRIAQAGELKQFRTIHIATHALVDDERPENSALILSQVDLPDPLQAAMEGTRIYDGRLTAAEIVREWKLDADLVSLSACETALGRKVAGEGYVGFAHAFLQAGARSLLVSLWKTEDRATSLLMQRFYENWLGRGGVEGGGGSAARRAPPMTKVEALQEAKRWLCEREEVRDGRTVRPYVHPFYWAGFVLLGDAG